MVRLLCKLFARCTVLVLAVGVAAPLASAQTAGALDPTFRTDPGATFGSPFSAVVKAIAKQGDRVLIGGTFQAYNGVPAGFLARLNADGSRDVSFGSPIGWDGSVNVLIPQADGKVIVAGDLVQDNFGNMIPSIVRLNVNGSFDATYHGDALWIGPVTAATQQSDGSLIAAAYGALYRFEPDGTIDPNYYWTDFNNTDTTVYAMAARPEGGVILAGWLSDNGSCCRGMAWLTPDGQIDGAFPFQFLGFYAPVMSILVQPDGKIIAGGSFVDYYEAATQTIYPAHGIARLNPDGSFDTTFNAGLGVGGPWNPAVAAIAAYDDDYIVAGGIFSTYNGAAAGSLARILAGTLTPTTTTVTCASGAAYTGSAQTPCTATVTGTDGFSQPVNVAYTNNTNAGTATASASFASDPHHAGSGDSATFTIAPAGSMTTVSCPASVVYTGNAQMPCAASVTGAGWSQPFSIAVTYSNNVGAGTATASASYDGDVNHTGSSGAQTFAILKATPIVTWAGPADITSGTALGAAQLNATASVPGTFAYSPAAGTVLPAGNGQTLTAVFTPADTANYTGATAAVTINVTGGSTSPLAQLVTTVMDRLVALGVLTPSQASALGAKLLAAVDAVARGNRNAARGQLGAFVNDVNALVRSRRLTPAQAQPLIEAASAIIAGLGR